MIVLLRGRVLVALPPRLVVETRGGIGYELEAPLSVFMNVQPGSEITVHTHLVVREDAHLLFGFESETQRELFRTLIRINGVGPKVALAILSTLAPADLVAVVQHDDARTLQRVPGIGGKTAARLLVELRDRLDGLGLLAAGAVGGAAGTVAVRVQDDAEAALLALGYKPAEARRAILDQLDATPDAGAAELIRDSLRRLSGR